MKTNFNVRSNLLNCDLLISYCGYVEIITPAAYQLKIVTSQTFLLKSEEYSCDSYYRSNLNMSDSNTNSLVCIKSNRAHDNSQHVSRVILFKYPTKLKYHVSTKNNWLVEICNANHCLINVQFILTLILQ